MAQIKLSCLVLFFLFAFHSKGQEGILGDLSEQFQQDVRSYRDVREQEELYSSALRQLGHAARRQERRSAGVLFYGLWEEELQRHGRADEGARDTLTRTELSHLRYYLDLLNQTADYYTAVEVGNRWLPAARRAGHKDREAKIRLSLATSLLYIDSACASAAQNTLAISSGALDLYRKGIAYTNLAEARIRCGDLSAAWQALDSAALLGQQAGDDLADYYVTGLRMMVQAKNSNWAEMRRLWVEAQRLSAELGVNSRDHAKNAYEIAALEHQLGNSEEAASILQQCLKLFFGLDGNTHPDSMSQDDLGFETYAYRVCALMAEVRSESAPEEALSWYRLAFRSLVETRRRYGDYRSFNNRTEKGLEVYRDAIPLAVSQGRNDLAFLWMEQARSLRYHERTQAFRRSKTNYGLAPARSQQLHNLVQAAKVEMGPDSWLLDSLLSGHIHPDWFINPGLSFRDYDLDQAYSEFAGSTVVSYYIDSPFVAVAVLADQQLKMYLNEEASKQIEVASQFKAVLSNPRLSVTEFEEAGLEFYTTWLKDYVEIEKVDRLVVLPDGDLNLIPFAAIPVSKGATGYHSLQYLIRDVSPSYRSSLFSTASLSQADETDLSVTREGLVLMVPEYPKEKQLQGAIREGRMIRNRWKGQYILDEEISTEEAGALIGGAQILHYAGHANSSLTDPEASYLDLGSWEGDPQHLYYRDIANASVDADLVVLNACETGVGPYGKSDGVLGLHRAFEFAGANSILLSLWRISDRSSSAVIESFYDELTISGTSKDEALRLAQLSYLDGQEGSSHPFYWAGFGIYGEVSPLDEDLLNSLERSRQDILWLLLLFIPGLGWLFLKRF